MFAQSEQRRRLLSVGFMAIGVGRAGLLAGENGDGWMGD